jgi:hypothetical protein
MEEIEYDFIPAYNLSYFLSFPELDPADSGKEKIIIETMGRQWYGIQNADTATRNSEHCVVYALPPMAAL